MKIFKSIKWRLQIWYGLILVAVLAGFGFTAYQLERNRQMRRVDEELQRRFKIVADALHRPPPEQQHPNGGWELQLFNGGPPEENPRPSLEFHLPPETVGLFDTNDPNGFYFAVATRDNKEIARGGKVFASNDFVPSSELKNSNPPPVYALNKIRVIIDRTPGGETICVGCSIVPELKELHRTALKLAGVGVIILIFGLTGGWWISSRAIRPISEISSVATKISAGDLSQRINVAETESELGQLAAVLNSTFARLESSFAQQKQFASDAAHELRTPVSVILTQTQTALNRERSAPEYRETVETCQRAAQRMRKLIGALLELARLDAGQEQMKQLRFDFSKTVADCVELIKPLADEHGVKIFTELSPLEITGDSERLAQVVTNLLTNAIQYNHEGGEIKITTKSENGMGILTVSDNGAGISAEDLPRVFERFYRADKSRSSGNAGLGLAISKAIVAAHGGTIEISSEENIGTTFRVHLPLASN